MLFQTDRTKSWALWTLQLLLLLFFGVVLFDPTDLIFALKKVIFIAIFVTSILVISSGEGFPSSYVLYTIFGLCIVSYIVLVALFGQYDFEFFLQYLFFWLGSLVLLSISPHIKCDMANFIILASIPLLVLNLLLILAFFIVPELFALLQAFLVHEMNTARIGVRVHGPYELPVLFLKTSPALLLPMGVLAQSLLLDRSKLKLLLFVLYSICLFMSGTRANILSASFIICLYSYFKLRRIRNGKIIFSAFIILVAYISIGLLQAFFDPTEYSNRVKSEHFSSYLGLFADRPHYLLFGQGLGTEFYSEGVRMKVAVTELSFMEVIRMFGLLIGCLILSIIVMLIWHVRKHGIMVFSGFATFFFVSGTNPILMSSTGMYFFFGLFVLCFASPYRSNDV